MDAEFNLRMSLKARFRVSCVKAGSDIDYDGRIKHAVDHREKIR